MSDDLNPEYAPLFDPGPVDALFALQEDESDTEMLQGILRQFLEDSDRTLAELETAVAAGDGKIVSALAHSLKGGAATFGLLRCRAWAFQIEQDGRQGRTDRLSEALAAARQAYAEGRPEIEARIQSA